MQKTFESFNLSKPINRALDDLNFTTPTDIQEAVFPIIKSGKSVVGIAQTGTGKTLAYLLPIVEELNYSEKLKPRVMIIVPTRELVVQVVNDIEKLISYKSIRVMGIYGGVNIRTQQDKVSDGLDIVVGTPGRLYDIIQNNVLRLQDIKKVVIDEVDEMLDLGFRPQLQAIFDLLPEKRQNMMFSATMTEEVEKFIDDYFYFPENVVITPVGTPLDSIQQISYSVPNFYTKINLVKHLLKDHNEYSSVIIFMDSKKLADLIFDQIQEDFWPRIGVIHNNKSQNNRLATLEKFEKGELRILIATDLLARGIDVQNISHVINFDTPKFPENYIHRIGRTGRAKAVGKAILFYAPYEEERKLCIEQLMNYEIPDVEIPSDVKISKKLIPAEEPKTEIKIPTAKIKISDGGAYHSKKVKNSKKYNIGGGQKIRMNKEKKYGRKKK
jgi:ATP-dependent RNA helicase RhlE